MDALEYEPFLLGFPAYVQGAVFAVSFGVRVFAAKRSVQWVGSSSPFSALPGAPDEVGTLL